MDRQALMLYLQNVRDLEVARHYLYSTFKNEERVYNRNLKEVPVDIKEKPYEDTCQQEMSYYGKRLLICVALVVVGFTMVAVEDKFGGIPTGVMVLAVLAAGLSFFPMLYFLFVYIQACTAHQASIQKNKELAETNQKIREQKKTNKVKAQALTSSWLQRKNALHSEFEKATNVLNGFYAMNILPSQYRNISAVCYIYDYMSTSQATFEETLVHEHMENGIQRLEKKLNEIIYRLEDVVYETRCMRQENRQGLMQVIQQNNDMLEQLQRVESNTANAASYAELSANYSKANAYFSAATYISVENSLRRR